MVVNNINLDNIKNKKKVNLWCKVLQMVNNCKLASLPTTYGGHSNKLGNSAKEIIFGSKKERKYCVNPVLEQKLDLAKLILLTVPKSFKLEYPRIHILKGANTG